MTVLNGMGVQGDFEGRPVFIPDSGNGKYLQVDFAHSERLWPWSGFLALYLTVSPEGRSVRGQVGAAPCLHVLPLIKARMPPICGQRSIAHYGSSLPS